MRVAIIGTAGRKEDGPKLNKQLYIKMVEDARDQISIVEYHCAAEAQTPGLTLVSGGAAWADHVAVSLYLMGDADNLILYLPCCFDKDRARFEEMSNDPKDVDTARIANYYHDLFSRKMGKDTRNGIVAAMKKGAIVRAVDGGFFARNRLVSKVDAIIAYTFGTDSTHPKDGGTSHTWDASQAKVKIHRPIGLL